MHLRSLIASLTFMTLACSHRPTPATVLFLCPHGAAKSLIAASYFNQLATQRKLPMSASAAATEEPYGEVPVPVSRALGAEGFDVSSFQPRRFAATDLDCATRVVTIDCDPPAIPTSHVEVERWDDVPKVSEDLDGSIASIRLHVARLVEELAAR